MKVYEELAKQVIDAALVGDWKGHIFTMGLDTRGRYKSIVKKHMIQYLMGIFDVAKFMQKVRMLALFCRLIRWGCRRNDVIAFVEERGFDAGFYLRLSRKVGAAEDSDEDISVEEREMAKEVKGNGSGNGAGTVKGVKKLETKEGGRKLVAPRVRFLLTKMASGVKVEIDDRPDTAEVITSAALAKSVIKAAEEYCEKHIGPKEKVGAKYAGLYNRIRKVMGK